MRDGLAHALGPRVVPDVRGVPRPARRRGRPRARAARRGSGLVLRPRRPVDRARGLPRRCGPSGAPTSSDACRAGRIAIGPVVRAAGLAAAVGRGARAQSARRARASARRSAPVSTRRLHAGLVRAPGAVPAALRRLRPRAVRLLARQRQRDRRAARRPTLWHAPDGSGVARAPSGEGLLRAPPRCPATSTRPRPRLAALGETSHAHARRRGPVDERHRPHAARCAHRRRGAGARAPQRDGRCGAALLDDFARTVADGERAAFRGELPARGREPAAGRVVDAHRLEAAQSPARRQRCSRLGPSRGRRWAGGRGAADESARRCAWRGARCCCNQAHDSICGCSHRRRPRADAGALRRRRGARARDDDARPRAARRSGRRAP